MHSPVNLDRRSFFKGENSSSTPMLLPPWSDNLQTFLEACTRCGDCLDACPENILVPGSGGFPTIDFKKGGCTFCGDCESACTTTALQQNEGAPPWQQVALISEQCLTQKGIVCRSCSDACEPEAIQFNWPDSHASKNRGVASPSINNDLCNGCGACISICPNNSLSIEPNAVKKTGT